MEKTLNERRNIIGERLKTFRKQNKITQDELAAKLQIEDLSLDRTTISKIERGERMVADYEVLAIATALNADVKWLLTGE